MSEPRIRISEIFYSLQGEGSLTGVPSVFVRTSGCNLRCTWCDTPYASWRPEGELLPIATIVDEIQRHPTRHVVLTGGEPMIAPGIHDLAAALRALGHHITIETAGTIPPDGIACDLASVSPKLANSTPGEDRISAAWVARHDRDRLQPDVLAAWFSLPDYQVKFVVSQPEDLKEIDATLAMVPVEIPAHRIQIMPEGTSVEALRRHRDAWVEICKTRGFRLIHRLHVELFGNTRGT